VVSGNATAGIFVTFPQPYLSIVGGFADQVCAVSSTDVCAHRLFFSPRDAVEGGIVLLWQVVCLSAYKTGNI